MVQYFNLRSIFLISRKSVCNFNFLKQNKCYCLIKTFFCFQENKSLFTQKCIEILVNTLHSIRVFSEQKKQ